MACNLGQNYTYPETHNDLYCSKGHMNTMSSRYNQDFLNKKQNECYSRSIEEMTNTNNNIQKNLTGCANAPICVKTPSYNYPIENSNIFQTIEGPHSLGSAYNRIQDMKTDNRCYSRSHGLIGTQGQFQSPLIENFTDAKQNLAKKMTSYNFPIENQNVYFQGCKMGSIGSHYNNQFFSQNKDKCFSRSYGVDSCKQIEKFNSSTGFDGIDEQVKKHSVINDTDRCGWNKTKKGNCGWTNNKKSCFNTPNYTFDDLGVTCAGPEPKTTNFGFMTQNMKKCGCGKCQMALNKLCNCGKCRFCKSKTIEKFDDLDRNCYSRSQGLGSAGRQFDYIRAEEYNTTSPKHFYIKSDIKKNN
jgi:hypothetical protein